MKNSKSPQNAKCSFVGRANVSLTNPTGEVTSALAICAMGAKVAIATIPDSEQAATALKADFILFFS
ncbi:MAG: hypothetical protein ACI9SQ_002273 [Rubritalea sp.]|jgi:hypothetical protein